MFRIGHGYDVHAFGEGDGITLGGQWIKYSRGLIAHSDGDVALHALCDALLGALGLGDIGEHFPDTDAAYENADSKDLLKSVMAAVKAKQYHVGNVDITIIAQAPKINPHKEAMKTCIAELLNVELSAVNIKATTTEKLGFVGRKEGIAVHAVALLMKADV